MTYALGVVVVTLCAARGDKFAQTVQRRRHLLPAAVRHHHRRVDGFRRVLLQDERRGDAPQGLYTGALLITVQWTVTGGSTRVPGRRRGPASPNCGPQI